MTFPSSLRSLSCAGAAALATILTFVPAASAQTETVRVGWCTSVMTNGVAPFAVAQHFGWFEEMGINLQLVNFGGSSDCVRNVVTGEVKVAVPSVEPVALLRQSGVDTQVFYTVFRRNIFGLAVPEDSPVTSYADLKGAQIGVTSMASNGVLIARSVAKSAGLDPDRDINIVVSGQPAQSVVLLQRNEIQAVSQWDTNYTLMEIAGLPMRMLEDELISSFPANSMIALPQTIENESDLLTRFGKAYTMGHIFTINNPRRAMEIFQEVYPEVVPAGLSTEESLDRGVQMLETVVDKYTLNGETELWGESNVETYQRYMEWLKDAEVLSADIDASELVNNSLIEAINADIDLEAIAAAE